MGSAVAAWGAGWAARSPDPVKATSKVTSSTPLRRRNARWSVLALTFSTAMRDREERRTVVRIGQDRAAELLPQRAVDKVGLQLCARCAAVARSSMGTTKRSTTLTRPGYAAPTGAPASHSIASVVACRGHTGGRQGKCLFWKLSFSEAYTVVLPFFLLSWPGFEPGSGGIFGGINSTVLKGRLVVVIPYYIGISSVVFCLSFPSSFIPLRRRT
jgi:hypothetical protein